MTSQEIRKKFITFFEERGHKVLPSASLIPENDPTVLFTTAGMQQFKRFYLYPNESPASKITTVQKCVRTGDIDEVGDSTHLTFFEMLGNFSFGYPKTKGSYFKEQAISWAWEFLTKELEINTDRLSCTYFAGDRGIPADSESKELLKKITALPDARILGTDFSETFWSLGTEGSPGGPTVEFYIDEVEIWNLVFNQYVMQNGEYVESELKGIDTGMGLERLATMLQGKKSVYDTDLFQPIIKKLEELSNCHPELDSGSKIPGQARDDTLQAFRIIADHLKAATLMISDGVIPSNKDRGYVLRRIIRRAIVKAKQIGINENFTSKIADVVCHSEVIAEESRSFAVAQDDIKRELEKEEDKFRKTLANGLKKFEKRILGGSQRIQNAKTSLSGEELFDLYQTYGFPIELSREIAADRNMEIGNEATEQFNNLMNEHQEKSRTAAAGKFKGGLADNKEETTRLHTAAHLLLAALREVLGPDVNQKGSNITEERLRFDFNYPEKLSPEQLSKIEELVNGWIEGKLSVEMEEMTVDEAKKSGATGVFDDRYGDKVKVYTIGPSTSSGTQDSVSREICGGPHVKNTSELGKFKIAKEESSSAGVRRIKAILS